MNIFTNDDYRRIQAWLKANAIKDSEFAISENTVPDKDILVITQNMSTVPTNYKIKIKDLLNSSLGKVVIDKITANIVKVNNSLTVDASKVILNNEKGTTLQDVLDYFEGNKLNRHTDDTFDGNLTVKKNITIEGNIKSHDDTITVEADLEATGEITDGQRNMLSDVNSAAKQWSLEYQDPQQDEPTVRAKYVLKDYRGVPKGSVIKIYKDSAITNVYLGTVEDACNPNTGEVTKHPIHDNNEALSIVYRLDTGKYSLVNVPIKMFTTEAEFDKYRGLGVTSNGQVFIKLASDVESSNYLHFNELGEITADGIETRILRDLGNIITSIADDGTMWGVYKEHEGTQETSTPNDGSRWGEFKRAEEIREQMADSTHQVFADNWDAQDDDPELPQDKEVVDEASYAYNWKSTDNPASDGKIEGNFKDLYQNILNLEQEQKQGGIYDVSAHNNGAVFESLSALLNHSNLSTLIPTSVRHGGMSIRFIQGSASNSNNKYVQYRLMSDTFNTTIINWQGVDDEPTAGSNNLVKSRGAYNSVFTNFALLISDLYLNNKVSIALAGIIGSDGKYQGNDATFDSHIYIKIAKGDVVNLKTKENAACVYGLVNSIQKSPTSDVADFINGESRRIISADSTETITASQNCYLYITVLSSQINYLPKEIIINGHEFCPNPLDSLKTSVESLQQNIKFSNDKYPKDYSINGLTITDIFGLITGETIKDISDVVRGRNAASTDFGYVGGDGKIQDKQLGYSHYIIPVLPGQTIKFKPNSTTPTDFAILKSYDPYTFTSSIIGRQRYDADSAETTMVLPSDAYYIVLTKTYSNRNFAPIYFFVNGQDAFNKTQSINDRVVKLEENTTFSSILSFNSISNSFDYYSTIGKTRYSKFTIKKEVNTEIVQNLWRLYSGNICDSSFNNICDSIYSGENEWAAAFTGFHATEGFVGGFHGGEDCEGDNNCFVKFFADGELIDSAKMSSDFEIKCRTFEYIQYSTLHKVKTSSGLDIDGHPIFAHHLKHTIFKDGKITCKNVVIVDTSVSTFEYFSGLFCVSKDVSKNCIIPTGINAVCKGDNSEINSNDNIDSEIIFYNSQNSTLVKVSSEFIRGLDVDANINNLVEKIWDRINDSKYYRYILNSNGISLNSGDIIETQIIAEFS